MHTLRNLKTLYPEVLQPVALLGLGLLMLTLTGCMTTTASVVTDSSCDVFQPILWSQLDTAETVQQVVEHNAVYSELCVEGAADDTN